MAAARELKIFFSKSIEWVINKINMRKAPWKWCLDERVKFVFILKGNEFVLPKRKTCGEMKTLLYNVLC